jgi:hypothetical protein
VTASSTGNVFSDPTVKFIGNVFSDNVLSSSESATTSFAVQLEKALIGDTVTVNIDGALATNIVLDSTNFNASTQVVTVGLTATDWGGDGVRNLTASIARNGISFGTSGKRSVYISSDASHWSSDLGTNGLWFDPNSLTGTSGSSVTSYTASNRNLSLSKDTNDITNGGNVVTSAANTKGAVLLRSC